ncbi:hypothetical protein INT47_002386 [Mucor saturninus]|uniref:Uncharacterized protein n=1 Tax=Mucor saturninus TaxID=64648 RepID=A0A8H7VDG2_9FUNG|nr:hypothetical protein INT47_002386 [Mucor saturninus]
MTRLTLTSIVLATLYAMVVAETAASGCEKNVSVTSQGDLDAISSCTVFKGVITMDIVPAAHLKLDGVQQLIGDLVMSGNVDLVSFSAPSLQKVDGNIKIINHTILNKLELPLLTEVNGFHLSVLPALEVINFPAGLVKVNSLRIEDTRAPQIDGLKSESIESFTLLSNKHMRSNDLSSLKGITGDMLILGNNPEMPFIAENLASIKTATFLNVADIQMPALTIVQSDISFHENEFSTLALDKLERIGGTVTIVNNNKLTETSFKSLAVVNGALSIGNNTQLPTIDGFPVLSEIHGTADLAGSFSEYKLPALKDVRGGMRLQTTSNKVGCSDLERKLKGENIAKGNTWSCSASMQESELIPTVGQNPSLPNSGTTSGGGGSSNGGTSNGKSGSNSGGSVSNGKSGSSGSGNMETSGSSKVFVQGSTLLAFVVGMVYNLCL